jgi:hypothetical protein
VKRFVTCWFHFTLPSLCPVVPYLSVVLEFDVKLYSVRLTLSCAGDPRFVSRSEHCDSDLRFSSSSPREQAPAR